MQNKCFHQDDATADTTKKYLLGLAVVFMALQFIQQKNCKKETKFYYKISVFSKMVLQQIPAKKYLLGLASIFYA